MLFIEIVVCLKYYDYVLREDEYLQVVWSRGAVEEYVQDLSFAFSSILNLLQQNHLSYFLTICFFFVWLVFPPFVLKVL